MGGESGADPTLLGEYPTEDLGDDRWCGMRGGDPPRLPPMLSDNLGDATDCPKNGRWSWALWARRLTLTAYILPVCTTKSQRQGGEIRGRA